MNPKLPPVIGAPRGCCGHASEISLLLSPWFAVCAPHATPSSVPGYSYCCTLFCLKSHFGGCFWSNGNKKTNSNQQKTRLVANLLPSRLLTVKRKVIHPSSHKWPASSTDRKKKTYLLREMLFANAPLHPDEFMDFAALAHPQGFFKQGS